MSKVPGKVGFDQKATPVTPASSKKNPGKVGFVQEKSGAGKKSSKKNPGKVPFTQKTAAMTKSSSAKNPGKASFDQPSKGGSAPMPKSSTSAKTANAKAGKVSGNAAKKVSPPATKFTSVDDVVSYRKKRYGA